MPKKQQPEKETRPDLVIGIGTIVISSTSTGNPKRPRPDLKRLEAILKKVTQCVNLSSASFIKSCAEFAKMAKAAQRLEKHTKKGIRNET